MVTSAKFSRLSSGFCSGIFCRGILVRSFGGKGLAMTESTRRDIFEFASVPDQFRARLWFADKLLQRLALGFAVHGIAFGQAVKVHLVRVEFRAVHAGKLAAAGHLHATTAAHASAVHHDWVEAHDRLDAAGTRLLGDSSHHRDWANCQHHVNLSSARDQRIQLMRDQTFLAVATVVRGHKHLVADRPRLVLQDKQVLRAGTEDGGDMVPDPSKRLGDRIGDRGPHTAADHHHRSEQTDIRRATKRTDYIEDRIARVQSVKQLGRLAYALHNDRNGAVRWIGISDGQRDAFAVLVNANNDELAGLLLPCDAWSHDTEQFDVRCQKARFCDAKSIISHGSSQPFVMPRRIPCKRRRLPGATASFRTACGNRSNHAESPDSPALAPAAADCGPSPNAHGRPVVLLHRRNSIYLAALPDGGRFAPTNECRKPVWRRDVRRTNHQRACSRG